MALKKAEHFPADWGVKELKQWYMKHDPAYARKFKYWRHDRNETRFRAT